MSIAQRSQTVHERLLSQIAHARMESDALFNILPSDSLYERPIPERHRFIFYVGHLEAFDWNLLSERALGLKSFDPALDRLFAFGIDPVGGGLPSDQPGDWPSLAVVREYVRRIRAEIDEKLARETAGTGVATGDGSPIETLLNVAIEHRLMHLETLTYMLHQLAFDKKIPQASPRCLPSGPATNRMIEIPSGIATLGLVREATAFGWDNEFEAQKVVVPGFEIDEFMVSNGEYLQFVGDGGYEARELWSDDAWSWKASQKISHPVFWRKNGDQWLYHAMFEEVPLPLDWPVYVSHAEATAYARWAGNSLPTEAEWHRAAFGTAHGDGRYYPWGGQTPSSRLGNFDFDSWNPQPVNATPEGRSAFGVHGLLGNGWEWTSTVFAPFPGFQPFSFYPGYSADFFDGRHFVMKGGSSRTAACMLRPTFRNWFQPHYQYVYAGFRCVRR